MGSVASTGKNNDELIDNLVEHDSIKNERVERIMRLVDRGKFMPLDEVLKHAYSDSAWKSDTGDPGFLHISAPCIYTNVLENLDVQKGMSFLNIGSGTGYLSTIIGFFLGENGVNHGVELYENVVNFANERIPLFQSSEEACVFDWCSPTYFIGNAFQIQDHMKYDRIYCGALVPECQRAYFCSFLKVDGILIMPYGHSLQRIIRKSEKLFSTRDLSAVTFSHLIPVNSDKNSFSNRPVSLPQYEPKSLQFICRNKIRRLIRQNLRLTQQVEIYSLCAEKLIKDGKNQRSRPARSYGASYSLVQDRLNPVVILQRGGTGHFLTSRTILPLDPRNEDPDIPPPNNVQGNNRTEHFRHLFALFTRDRIHRHHEAIARRAADYGENVTDVSDSDSEEGGNGQRRRGRGNNNNNERQQQQNYVHGPVNDVYNFVFETEPDDDEQEELDNDNFSTIPFGGDDNEEEEEDEAELLTINYVDNEEEDENEGEQSIIDGYPIALNKNSSLTNSNNNSTIDLTKQQGFIFYFLIEGNIEDGWGIFCLFYLLTDKLFIKENSEKYEDDSNESFKTANDNLDSSMDEEIKKAESNPKNKILKNGWSSINNNKRLRTFTYNSMEMPQSRRSSNSVENETEGEGQSTSCSNNLNKLFNNSNEEEEKTNIKTNNVLIKNLILIFNFKNKIRKIITKRKLKNNKDSCCCSSTKANEDDEEVDMEEKEVEEEEEENNNKKNNKTKAEDKDQQLSTFYKLFVKLIETLPLNTKMRKFIIYEDE